MTSVRLMQLLPCMLLLLAQLLVPCSSQAAQLRSIATDDDQAAFTLSDLMGQEHQLSDYRGKVVLVNFWASWCPPCIHEMPALTRLQQKLSDMPFEVLALNVGEKKYRVRKFTSLIDFDLRVLLDTSQSTFNEWGVVTLPTSFLVDGRGKIRYRVRGNPDWDDDNTIATVKRLISETTESNSSKEVTE